MQSFLALPALLTVPFDHFASMVNLLPGRLRESAYNTGTPAASRLAHTVLSGIAQAASYVSHVTDVLT